MMPNAGGELLDYFDTAYVTGSYRRVNQEKGVISLPRTPTSYPPATWNVYLATVDGGHRTNNYSEAWNRRFGSVVGHSHSTVWKAIDALRSKESTVTMKISQDRVGAPSKKRRKSTLVEMQRRLRSLCERFPFLQFKDWLGEPDKPLEGFPWMSGSDPHTEGIVFWSHLFRAVTADGKEVAVLLVDTQGSFGTSSSTTVSVHIFALSVLISSTQVFNVMRNLQLDHLQHLQMYYKYGKYVQGLEGRTSGFQLCVFLVRDWQWPKEYEFGWEGGERLLQKILGAESKNKATDELRDLRTYFESCLSSRNCFLMPSPGLTDDGCSLNGAVNGMTPSFNEYLRDFVRGVLSPSKLVVKTVDGEPRTAWELCKFVELEHLEAALCLCAVPSNRLRPLRSSIFHSSSFLLALTCSCPAPS
ncbi:hypothetical protein HPB47_002345 [Ixodes persulcatus]|uniref:Uncharacterized protein n=1 Tax=Ixodes persulcatus TaxID=34615 RepID=A0AC60PN10_IXOPE|nr:hypothetical protein HPB47_002345 [Ixodes persulcatus]